ncbi:MAG: peptide-methionine (S)-S-oxide reductase MsrA [Vicingaceae bacterium]
MMDSGQTESDQNNQKSLSKTQTITLGAGCFWCVEAIFDQLKGVLNVKSGYSGGSIKNPGYREICTGRTGHAEVCQLTFDPKVITLEKILEVFFQTHDPTTLNRQGADVGTQYRSAIFYHTEEQNIIAQSIKSKLDKAEVWADPIVTEISPIKNFYAAEEYHQEYFDNNGNAPYCRAVIQPKVEKFKKVFKELLK